MKKLILVSIFFAMLTNSIVSFATDVTSSVNSSGVTVTITDPPTNMTYFTIEKQASTNPAQHCMETLNVYDNNCNPYWIIFDDGIYVKIAKGTGTSITIPFGNLTANDYGTGDVGDGLPHRYVVRLYNTPYVPNNRQVWGGYTTFTAPNNGFVYPACPNKAPDAYILAYPNSIMVNGVPVTISYNIYTGCSNPQDNCPMTIIPAKDGTTLTAANVKTLCGSSAILLLQADNMMISGISIGGHFTSIVANSFGADQPVSVDVPTPAVSTANFKGKRKN